MVIMNTDKAEKKIMGLAFSRRKALEEKHIGEQIEGWERSLDDVLHEDYDFAIALLYDLEEDIDVEIDCGTPCCTTNYMKLKYPLYIAICPKCGRKLYEYIPPADEED